MAALPGIRSTLMKVLFLLLVSVPRVPAPVPRCSPFIIINKVVEWNSIFSDSNPYFPVPPCEYGGPLQALAAGDWDAVFVLARPQNVPRHNFYELIWFLKTGLPRIWRVLAGKEPFVKDVNILKEGYQHYTPFVKTHQLGHGTKRRPELIDNKAFFNRFVGDKIRSLFTEGPDKRPVDYTPTGPLQTRRKGPVSPYQLVPSSTKNLSQPPTHKYYKSQKRRTQLSPHRARHPSLRDIISRRRDSGVHKRTS